MSFRVHDIVWGPESIHFDLTHKLYLLTLEFMLELTEEINIT